MQSKKGIYMLTALISAILIFFFILFFVHEKTLENGILFKVSFGFENAQDITYNFYNQNGKIEKVEKGNNFENIYLLEKTDYNSIKLLRKIIKKQKELKEKPTGEGITIYNGQNKKYYLIPFDSDVMKELSSLIIDGYIHNLMEEKTNWTTNELYIYQEDEELKWTTDGSKERIIHTYRCETEDCQPIYVNKEEHETVIYDGENYIYNYVTRTKEKINTEEQISSVKFIKYDNQIIGLNLQNNKKETCYYDINQKECLTNFTSQQFEAINSNLILESKKGSLPNQITLRVWDRFTKEEKWKIELVANDNVSFHIEELKKKDATYYLLVRTENKKTTYQVWNQEWKEWLDGRFFKNVWIQEDGNLGVEIDQELMIECYDFKGNIQNDCEKPESE